jgi:hypothetical protein
MATRTWTGSAADGNFDTASNWGGTVPVTGDTAIISAAATYGITSGLDRSADGAGAGLNLVLLEIEDGFKHDIGTSTAALMLTADELIDRGKGNTWFTSKTGSAALDTDLVTVDKSGGHFVLDHSGASNVSQLRMTGGDIRFVGSAVAIPLVYFTPRTPNAFFTSLGSVVITAMYMSGGVWNCQAGATTVYLMGGTMVVGSSSAITLTTVHQLGGSFEYAPNSAGVTTTTHTAIAGSINGRITGADKTITTLNRGDALNLVIGPKLIITTDNIIGD